MEAEWIHQAQRGDELAFQHLVDEHRDAVFRLAFLMLRHEDDAQDVTQETFFRAYKNLNRFDTSRPMRPWLLRITANLCRNQRRDLGRYWRALWRFSYQKSEVDFSAEQQVIQEAEVEAVLNAIQRLREPEQEIIYLRYFLGLSIEDAAEVLKVRPGTVKSRLHRALKQLTLVIQQQYPVLAEGRSV
ncbi:MAG: RNA polymerase sigma factor [Anaerolineae bacterium]|nr:MAG: RNA polymerase sigma factor [Anaerolineae bacterium]